ncbi:MULTISPECIES: sensor histidine kinase [unclassified Blastococcus]
MSSHVDVSTPRTVVLADGRGTSGREDGTTRRVLVRMSVGTVVILVVIAVGGYFASARLARHEVLENIRTLNEAITHALVEPTSDELRAGDPAALAALDDAVREHLLPETPIERVKLWTDDGRIVYSDEAELIGDTFPLAEELLDVLRSEGSSTTVKDLSAEENRLERTGGDTRLLEVYTAVHTDSGENLLFEAYVRYDVLEQRQRDVLASFAGIGLVALGLLAVLQFWLASATLRRLQRERSRMARRTAEAVEEQRRQMARDLHDGVVQDLIGATLLVSAGTGPLRAAGRPDAAEDLRAAEASIRTSVRSLRSLLIDLYPANLRSSGLRAALLDLIDPVRARGVRVHLDLPDDPELPDHLEAALYRTAREAVRNAVRDGHAGEIWVTVRLADEEVSLAVRDDGDGFDPAAPVAEGHLGLRGLADEAEVLGGVLEVTSAIGRGTELRLVLPR